MEAMLLVVVLSGTACFDFLSNFHCDGVSTIHVGERNRQDTYMRHDQDLRPKTGRFMSRKVDRHTYTYPIH